MIEFGIRKTVRTRFAVRCLAAMMLIAPLSACSRAADPPKHDSMGDSMTTQQLDRNLVDLGSEHFAVRARATSVLLANAEKAYPRLVEIVGANRTDQQSMTAILVLGRFDQKESVEVLRQRLETGPLRWEAAKAIEIHLAPEATAALIAALEHAEAEVVFAAAVALGGRSDEKGREPLERLLEHKSASIRYRAVFALGRLGPDKSISKLRERAGQEPDAEVRELIQRTVGKVEKAAHRAIHLRSD